MSDASRIPIARGASDVALLTRYGNRHGLITGATGTGKTVTLQTLAEGYSARGVPVFMADVKGDLAGMSQPAHLGEKLRARLDLLGLQDFVPAANPVIFWDIYGRRGHPLRTTISELGPLLLGRLLELTDVQQGVLQIVFRVADEQGLLLLDVKDLQAMLSHVAENAKAISAQYGLVSPQSIAAVQRALLSLADAGAEQFFGEPAFELGDFFAIDPQGRGAINIMAAEQLILKPRLYATFLLWLLSELFENLPEVGDLDRPRMVFFFDEAHLLFDDAPPALLQRVEQVVRLIRSKGVGVYFVTQNPLDVPNDILGQLGNRVQHALRAFTPRDQKAVRAAAETFVPNPQLNVVEAITQLGVGEALVSTLQDGGIPCPVQRAYVYPPRSRIGAISDEERAAVRAQSPIGSKYDQTIDRESAFELLRGRSQATALPQAAPMPTGSGRWSIGSAWGGGAPPPPLPNAPRPAPTPAPTPARGSNRQGPMEAFAHSLLRSAGTQVGRSLMRGVLGALIKR